MTPDQLVRALEVERARPTSPPPSYAGTRDTPGECRRRLEALEAEAMAAEDTRRAESQRRKRANARRRLHERHRAHQRAREAAQG